MFDLIDTINFCMKLWEILNIIFSIFVIMFLYWMRFIAIASNTDNNSLIDSYTSNMNLVVVRNRSCLSCFLKIFVIHFIKHRCSPGRNTHSLYRSIYMYIHISEYIGQRILIDSPVLQSDRCYL